MKKIILTMISIFAVFFFFSIPVFAGEKLNYDIEDFNFKVDKEIIYDGLEHPADVTLLSSESNTINVHYQKKNKDYFEDIEGIPMNAGEYKVLIDIATDDTHEEITDFTLDEWTFEILKAPIILKSEDLIETFKNDTQSVNSSYIKISGYDLKEGTDIVFKDFPTLDHIGKIENTFTYALLAENILENYEIIQQFGFLELISEDDSLFKEVKTEILEKEYSNLINVNIEMNDPENIVKTVDENSIRLYALKHGAKEKADVVINANKINEEEFIISTQIRIDNGEWTDLKDEAISFLLNTQNLIKEISIYKLIDDKYTKLNSIPNENGEFVYETDEGLKIHIVPSTQIKMECVEKTYTVTFYVSKDVGVMTQTVTSDGKLIKPDDPSREYFIFKGWFKDAFGFEPWDFDTDTVSGDMTLYAVWEFDYAGLEEMKARFASLRNNFSFDRSNFSSFSFSKTKPNVATGIDQNNDNLALVTDIIIIAFVLIGVFGKKKIEERRNLNEL